MRTVTSDPIEWIVLDTQEKGGKCLLLSKYGLEVKQYHNEDDNDLTWEKSSIRKWLNNEFLQSAFNGLEQSAIMSALVDNSIDQCNHAWIENYIKRYKKTMSDYCEINTQDQIFLLSYRDVNGLYFKNDESRICYPTDYAIAHGASISMLNDESKGACFWWLRSPGQSKEERGLVACNGFLDSMPGFFSKEAQEAIESINAGNGFIHFCVRPALWLDLESDYFDNL